MLKKSSSSRQLSVAPSAILSHILPPSLAPSSDSLPLPRLIVFDLDYTLWPFWVDTHVTPPLKPNSTHSAAADRYGEDYTFYSDVPSILQALPQLSSSSLPSSSPSSADTTIKNSNNGSSSNDISSSPRVKLAVASRTCAPSLARELLKMLHLQPLAALAHTKTGGSATGGSGAGGSSSKDEKPRRAIDAFEGGLEIYPSSKIRHFEALHKRTGIPYEDMLFFDDEARNRDTESLGVTMWLVRDGVTWTEIEKGVAEWRKRRGYKAA
ncbi:hypothetical protein GMORB2_6622 [Geosmithia morbida]|uniref:Magnesium-dependent phosphatase-1 n=1 Tax=Geosmithia morbida TaxID=1094350 RepID=A0A9P4YY09_9HYPO|nr:uncharacterized protein GMORB2_6622 [Geosmithia morbida]KAF4123074.1 hypothetical protein GMORB2_6622 [Geosmithia morbida]